MFPGSVPQSAGPVLPGQEAAGAQPSDGFLGEFDATLDAAVDTESATADVESEDTGTNAEATELTAPLNPRSLCDWWLTRGAAPRSLLAVTRPA